MARKRIIVSFISFTLNFFFLFYVLDSYFRRKNPNFSTLQFENGHNFGRSNAGYVTTGTWERMQCSNKEPAFRITQRGRYFVLNNYVQSSGKFSCNESVTYATHADHSFLENLILLAERWDGPVSVAVHAPGADFLRALASIVYLRSCASRKLRRLVTFHMYFRDESFPAEIPSRREVEAAVVDCDVSPPFPALHSNHFPYPVNVGRNVARENSMTRYLLVSDIELFPSPGLVHKFLKLANAGERAACPRVYPLPVFEVASGTEIPRNKTELVELIRCGKAQIFHKTICPWCHRIPNFTEWMEMKEEDELKVFHVAKRQGDLVGWEPIYIGTNEEPFYDERLIWEGKRDKMTQGYIMCVLDYEFHILDSAFLTHKPGIKKTENNHLREYLVRKALKKIENVIYPQLQTLFGHRGGCKF